MSIIDAAGGLLANGLSVASSVHGTGKSGATSSNLKIGLVKNYLGSSVANDIGEGGNLWFNVVTPTGLQTLSSKAGVIEVALKADASSGAGKSMSTTVVTFDIATDSSGAIAAGWLARVPVPPDRIGASDEYLGFYFLNKSTSSSKNLAATAQTVDAWIGMDSEGAKP